MGGEGKREDFKNLISLVLEAGYQIDKDAFDFLKEISQKIDLKTFIKSVIEEIKTLPETPLFITRKQLEEKAKKLGFFETASTITGKTSFQPYARDVESDFKVISDPTKKIGTSGSLEDCIEYFRDRFRKISRIIRNRVDSRDSSNIMEALKSPENSRVKFICIISDKRETKRGIFLRVEDLENLALVFVPSEKHDLYSKAQKLILDQVVCITAIRGRNDLFIAEEIILPDVPLKKPNKSEVPICAALISDLHVGSKMFMEKEFRRFVMWLRGELGNETLRNLARRVKYLVIAGDLVDGVGIYPQQFDELEIKDLSKQYQLVAEILREIPEYIEIIIIPGNHDASRRALPQPAIPKKYAEPLYEDERIHLLGNPSVISLHGVKILVSHGRSLDDIISTVPNMSFQNPDEAMKILLQCRHLAPIYGARTLIAPEKVDHLVIEHVPDIFHAGHVHMMKYSSYRGILVVNSGAWQEQTEYQREMGHVPNPGIAPIVNLQTLQVTPINFVAL